jgi:Protein ENHANCED DISEASE RESISTANCE 2, C-terminal
MTERRPSVSLRKNTNAFVPPSAMHPRARSAERPFSHDHDDMTAVISSQNEEALLVMAGFEDDDDEDLPQRNRLESDSSVSKQMQVLGLRRANSDPFENAGKEDEEESGIEIGLPIPSSPRRHARASMLEEESNALPTLNRFPFAETKNRNCWSEPPHDAFMIRGPNYLKDKKKIVCKEFLLQSRGCDLFLSDHPESVDMTT